MKVNVKRVSIEAIELSKENVKEVTRARLLQMIAPGEYLRYEPEHAGGKGRYVLKQDDPNWRHGSVHEEFVRVATELDIAVCKVLEAL